MFFYVHSDFFEKASLEARKAGHSVIEKPLEDGSIKLTLNVGGAV